jgi:TonB family protein
MVAVVSPQEHLMIFPRLRTAVVPASLVLALVLATGMGMAAQQSAAHPTPSYPDKPAGLERLVKDLLLAHKSASQAGDVQHLVQSLALPDPDHWFSEVFGEGPFKALAQSYAKNQSAFLEKLDAAIVAADRDGFNHLIVKKYEESCDDDAGELTYPLLMARITPVPLYELRMAKGNSFQRISAFSYVDGGFRYIGPLNISDEFAPSAKPNSPVRIRVSGNVQAAHLLKEVFPTYPDVARREHLQGTVRLHAIVGTDGSIQQLRVVRGYCSLSKAAYAGVKQWRYSPTLHDGKPVEVDTMIDVTFSLRY